MRPRRLLPPIGFLMATCLAPAQGFRERVDVELVRIELLAADSHGRPLKDLTQEEVRVLVDGRPVRIEGFDRPSLSLAESLPPLPQGAQSLPAVARAPAKESRPPADSAPYYMAILVDETSSEQSNREAALGQLFQFLQKDLPPGVEVLLARFSGVLRVECPWTSDIQRLRAAAAGIAQRRAASLLAAPGQNPQQGVFNLQLEAMEAVMHVRTSLAALFDALRVFPEKPGRKALYFVTDGGPFLMPSEIAKDLIATAQSTNVPGAVARAGNEVDYDRDLLVDSLAWDRTRGQSLLTDITRLALLRGIEIHPVRAAAHDLGSRVRVERGRFSGGSSGRSLRDASAPPTTDIASGQGMETVAEATGGEAVLSRRFFTEGLQREVDSRDAAYAVSFRDPFAGDHRFHRIEISSSRSGTRLRYRRGYRVLDTRESLLETAANRLYVPADENPLGVRLQLESRGVDERLARVQITVAYPLPPQAGGAASGGGSVEILGFCGVRDGPLIQLDLTGKAEPANRGETSWLVRSGFASLKPGAYRWSFAIRDEQTGITSYLTFDRSLP